MNTEPASYAAGHSTGLGSRAGNNREFCESVVGAVVASFLSSKGAAEILIRRLDLLASCECRSKLYPLIRAARGRDSQ